MIPIRAYSPIVFPESPSRLPTAEPPDTRTFEDINPLQLLLPDDR